MNLGQFSCHVVIWNSGYTGSIAFVQYLFAFAFV